MSVALTSDYTDTPALPQWLAGEGGDRHLLASRELAGGHCFFPPIPPSSPLAGRYETVRLSPRAVLYSFTVIHPNQKANKPPFTLVYADFPEQVRVFGVYHDPAGARPVIGQPLRVRFSAGALGELHYAFEPV